MPYKAESPRATRITERKHWVSKWPPAGWRAQWLAVHRAPEHRCEPPCMFYKATPK